MTAPTAAQQAAYGCDAGRGCACISRPAAAVAELRLAARAVRGISARRLRLTAAILATGLALAACQPADNSSSSGSSGGTAGGADAPTNAPSGHGGLRDYTCEGKFQPPPTGIGIGASIKGTLFVKCPTHTPIEHHVTLILERNLNGHWIAKAERTWDGVPQDPMSIYILTTSCVPGSWRVHSEIWGVAASGKPFATSTSPLEEFSEPKDVHPSDCG